MTISVTCAECTKSFAVNDQFQGKRVRCKYCQAAVPVPKTDDFSDGETLFGPSESDDEADSIVPRRSKVRKTSRKRKASGAPSSFQRFLIYVIQNPWAGMALIFLLVWVPLSLIVPVPIMALDVVIVLLAMLGFAIGILASLVGVALSNPFEFFTTMIAGALLSQVAPNAHSAGVITGKITKKAGMKNFGDADTGAAGRMTVYCGAVIVLFLAHFTALLCLLVSSLK